MARQSKQAAAEEMTFGEPATTDDPVVQAAPSGPVTETVTYCPGREDPVSVEWGGHTFHANVPKEITGHPDGTAAEQINHHIIERARDNRQFMVGDQRKPRDAIAQPVTSDEYKTHMISWMMEPFRHVEDLIGKFASERNLQAACGVGSDDYDYLGSLFMPKLMALARADEMTELQLAAVWARHGYNVLPWAT
jgi:hypothetical protein